MPLGHILTKQALSTLTQLHAELAGKIDSNQKQGDKLRASMVQVEAVIKMLQPDFDVAGIAVKRRVTGNPWFKRGTLYRNALDVLRKATAPLTTGEIVTGLIAAKGITPTAQQARNLEAGIRRSLDNNNGKGVMRVDGNPFRWRLACELGRES